MMLRKLLRVRRGSAISEFAFSAVILIFTLLMTMEFGVEVFVRQQVERAAGEAAHIYAETKSPSAAQDAASAVMLRGFRDCLEPVDIVVHNNLTSLKSGTGRQAKGNASDAGARIARIELTCRRDRLTPAPRLWLGETMGHSAVSFVRIRK